MNYFLFWLIILFDSLDSDWLIDNLTDWLIEWFYCIIVVDVNYWFPLIHLLCSYMYLPTHLIGSRSVLKRLIACDLDKLL